MKTASLLLTSALLAWAGNAFADELRVNDFTISLGETKNISVELTATDKSYIAFEFYMTLPEGISITLDKDGYPDVTLNSARSSGHSLEVAKNADGSYHFLCYSSKNKAFVGTNGEILSMTVKADETAKEGTLQGSVFNLKMYNNLLMDSRILRR